MFFGNKEVVVMEFYWVSFIFFFDFFDISVNFLGIFFFLMGFINGYYSVERIFKWIVYVVVVS